MFGAFSSALYSTPNFRYKIKITEVSTGNYFYLTRKLTKIKYEVDLTTLGVTSSVVSMGPENCCGQGDNCYKLTPLSSGSDVFYSFPDLLGIWPAGNREGTCIITIKAENTPGSFVSIPDFTEFTIYLNNDTPGSMVDFPASVRISSTETPVTAFTDKYLYLDKSFLLPTGSSLCNCAYNFWLHAQSRATDGYTYIYRWCSANDNHYIELCD